MHLLPFLAISFLLSLVPFSVALSSSIYRCIVWKEALRIAIVFALFEAVFVAIGWLIGFSIQGFFIDLKIPVAAMIIVFIGARMFADSKRMGREQRTMAVESRRILTGFAFVISINTALLGMGLGMLYPEILILAGFVFGMVFLMTIAGVQAGKRGMMNLGRTAETVGSVGLIMICIVIVLQYLKIF